MCTTDVINNLEALTRHHPGSAEARLRRIFAALDQIDEDPAQDRVVTGVPVRHPTDRDPGLRTTSPGHWLDELNHCRQRAEEGDPASTRRVAELLELLDKKTEAVAWWHRAADAGDPDAILYVREIRLD